MSIYVAAYDIQDDASRHKVARILSEYGDRRQRSLFMVWVESDELANLKRRIGMVLSHQDQFDLIPVDQRPQRIWVGWQVPSSGYLPAILL